MSDYKSVITEFNEALTEIANVWKEQKKYISDPKMEQFGVSVLQPVSMAAAKINEQADEVDSALKKIADRGLI